MLNKLFVTIGLLIMAVASSVFTVGATERVIKFHFREIVAVDLEPGIHFKWPFVDDIKKFDGRLLTMDSTPERFLTAEKKDVIVDSFVNWRIGDVKTFYTTVAGDVGQANIRLDQYVKDAYRSEFSVREIKNLVSSDRSKIRETLIANVSPQAQKLGIMIVDVQINRIDLPEEVRPAVYQRMEAERARIAREFRSQGAEAGEGIRADADKQREIILAEAYRKSETLRGEGDAKAAEIYAKAYGEDADFFGFYRSMSAYKQSLAKPGNIMVIEPDSDFFKYFKNQK